MPPASRRRAHRSNESHPVIDLTCVDEPPGRPSRGRASNNNSLSSRHSRRSHHIGGHVSRNRPKKASPEQPIVVLEDEGQNQPEQQRLTKHDRFVLRKSKELRRASNLTESRPSKQQQQQRSSYGSTSEDAIRGGDRPWKRLFIDTSAMDQVLEDEVDDSKVADLAPAPDFMSAFSYQFKHKADPDEKSDVILLDDILPERRGDSEQSGRTKQATRGVLKNGNPVWDLTNAADTAWTSPTPATLNEDKASHETLIESHSARIESIRKAARFLQQQRKIQMEILQARQTPSPTPVESEPKTRNNMSAHWSPSCRKAMTFRKLSRSKSQDVVINLVQRDNQPKTEDEVRQKAAEETESPQEKVVVLEISDSGLESSSTQETSAQSNVTKKLTSEQNEESPTRRRESVADALVRISPQQAEMNARAIESLYISPDSSTANEFKSASAFDSPIGYVSPASSVSIASSSKTGRSQSAEYILSKSPRLICKDPSYASAAGFSPLSAYSESKEHASPLAHSPSSEVRRRSPKSSKGDSGSTLSRRHRAKSTGDLTSGYATKRTEVTPPFPEMKDPTSPAHAGTVSPATTRASFQSASTRSGAVSLASPHDHISRENNHLGSPQEATQGPPANAGIPFAPDLQCSSGISLEPQTVERYDSVNAAVTSQPKPPSSPKLDFTTTTQDIHEAPNSSHPLSPTYSEREMMIAALSLDSSHRTSSVTASFSPMDSPYSPSSSSRTPALPKDTSQHLETPLLSSRNTESEYQISPISVDSGENDSGVVKYGQRAVDRPSSPKIVMHSSIESSVSSGLSASPANAPDGIVTSPLQKANPSQRAVSPGRDQPCVSPISASAGTGEQDRSMYPASPNATCRSPVSEQGSTHTASHMSPRSPQSHLLVDGAIGTSPLSLGSGVARSPTSCSSAKSKKQVSFCDSPTSQTSTCVSPVDHEPSSVDVNLAPEECECQELGTSSATTGDIGFQADLMPDAHPIIQLENFEDHDTTRSIIEGPGMCLPASSPSQESGATAASYWAVQSLPAYLDEPDSLGASIIKPNMSCPSNTSLWSVDDQELSPSPSLQRVGLDSMEDTSGGVQTEKPASRDQADVMAILGSVQKSFGTHGYLFTWAMKPMVSFPHTNDSAVLKIEKCVYPDRPLQAIEEVQTPSESTGLKSILKDGATESTRYAKPEGDNSPSSARVVAITEQTEISNANLSSNHEQTQDKHSWTEDVSTSEDGASIISEDRGSESFDSLESAEMYDACGGAKWADQLFDQTCTWLESKNLMFSLPPSVQKSLQKNTGKAPDETVGANVEKMPNRRRGVSRRNTRSTPLTKCFGGTTKKRRTRRKDKTKARDDAAQAALAASRGGGERQQDSAILLSRDFTPDSDQRIQIDNPTKNIQSSNVSRVTTEGLRNKGSLVMGGIGYTVESQQSFPTNSIPPVVKSPNLHPLRLSTTRMQAIKDEIGKITSLLVHTGVAPENTDHFVEEIAALSRG